MTRSDPRIWASEVEWLNDQRLNIFVMVSLRQALIIDGRWEMLTVERAEVAARHLKNNVSNAIDRAAKRAGNLPIVTYLHHGTLKRFHFHVLAPRPIHMSEVEFAERFTNAAEKIPWVYDHFHFTPIGPTDDDRRGVLHYCQHGSRKSGDRAAMLTDGRKPAFAQEATYRKIDPADAGTIREAKKRCMPSDEVRMLVLAGTAIPSK